MTSYENHDRHVHIEKRGSLRPVCMMVEAFLEKGWEVHCLSLTPIGINHPLYHNHVTAGPFKTARGWMIQGTVLFFFPLRLVLLGWKEKVDMIVAFGSLYAFLHGLANGFEETHDHIDQVKSSFARRFREDGVLSSIGRAASWTGSASSVPTVSL